MMWLACMDVTGLDITRCRPHVSPRRWEKAAGYLRESDRKLSLGAELLLNHGLKTMAPGLSRPVQYGCDANGKPRLPGSPLHFSLSHSGAFAACAISNAPVGVDIEQMADADLALANRFFHQEETARILACDDSVDCFYQYWTLKESYLKCLGTGLSAPLNAFCVNPKTNPVQITQDGKPLPFSLRTWRLEGYRLAVCCRSGTEELPFEPLKTDIRDCLQP